MNYIIGLDCGGTKTHGVAYDEHGQELLSIFGGSGNLVVNFDQAIHEITQVLAKILQELGTANCRLIVGGVAGVDSGGLRERLNAAFASITIPQVWLNDGQLAHYSLLAGGDGLAVTAGTGSVVLAKQAGKWFRSGGWGHLLGDEGGAYQIAKSAIQTCLQEYDRGLPTSSFAQAVFDFFEVADVFALVKVVYQLDKAPLASLAQRVAAVAETDSQGQTIIRGAAEQLAQTVLALVGKLPHVPTELALGLNGSVFEHNQAFQQAFLAELRRALPTQKWLVLTKQEPCTKGAYYYYLTEKDDNQ